VRGDERRLARPRLRNLPHETERVDVPRERSIAVPLVHQVPYE
jgi:hypothetical protein